MARRLVNAFRNRMIDLYRNDELVKDLARMSIEEKTQGMKLIGIRDEHGHCDRGFALTIALTAGMDWAMSLHEALVEGDDEWV